MQHKQDFLLLWCAYHIGTGNSLTLLHFKTGYVALIVGSTLSLIQEEIDNYPFIENQVLYFKIRCVGFIGLIRCEKDLRIAHLFKLDAFQSNLRLWNGQLEWKLIWPIYFITFHHPLNKHYMDLISFGLFFKCSPEGELQQGLFFFFFFWYSIQGDWDPRKSLHAHGKATHPLKWKGNPQLEKWAYTSRKRW